MKNLYYICAQPAIQYYTWQVEVMINNFLKNGIHQSQIHILAANNSDGLLVSWYNLTKKYPEVGFFFYDDTRLDKMYFPSIKPHLMAKHFESHPELKSAAIFYHDCDMIFTKQVDWNKFLDDDVWYLSDTVSYIGAKYIHSKKYGIYERMCEIVGIPQEVPIENENNSGGAQYILKNVDATYWKKVESDSNELYAFFQQHLKAFPKTTTYHPIQSWTAEMWATLWNAWVFNHQTKVVKEMDFCWPNNPVKYWDDCTMFHNAGVTDTNKGMFHKGAYINMLPYSVIQDNFNSELCSYKYIQEILDTAKSSCLLQ